jgi:DNA-binding NarL/FixJ family response regulator
VQMPVLGGIEALRQIRSDHPEARVIVLTTYRNEDYIFPSLRAGARGYLLKDASREELTGAIRAVAAGQSLLDPKLVVAGRDDAGLTARELEVLILMADGHNNAQIAAHALRQREHGEVAHQQHLDRLGAGTAPRRCSTRGSAT